MEIISLQPLDDLTEVKQLFQEYWDSFGFTPCFQNFGAEVASLPGSYAPPGGRLAIAVVDGAPAGCVALRQFDPQRCEAKRLYVRDRFRGKGVGRGLLQWVIEEARAAGYSEMLGDTMPVMSSALAMYDGMGFERIPPYTENPAASAIHLRLPL